MDDAQIGLRMHADGRIESVLIAADAVQTLDASGSSSGAIVVDDVTQSNSDSLDDALLPKQKIMSVKKYGDAPADASGDGALQSGERPDWRSRNYFGLYYNYIAGLLDYLVPECRFFPA